jgi:hypothetical protein
MTSSMVKAGGDDLKGALGEFAGDLGVYISSSSDTSTIS